MARAWKTSTIGAGGVEGELNTRGKQGYKLFGIYPLPAADLPAAGVTFLLVWSREEWPSRLPVASAPHTDQAQPRLTTP